MQNRLMLKLFAKVKKEKCIDGFFNFFLSFAAGL
jgi:hypothetical protein